MSGSGMHAQRALSQPARNRGPLAGGFRRWNCHRFSHSLETAAAEHGSALGGLKGDSGFGSAFRTGGTSFRAHFLAAADPFRLALLAALGVVLKLFVVEEDLLARRKNELRAAVYARQNSISEFHWPASLNRESHRNRPLDSAAGPGSLIPFVIPPQGPGPLKGAAN